MLYLCEEDSGVPMAPVPAILTRASGVEGALRGTTLTSMTARCTKGMSEGGRASTPILEEDSTLKETVTRFGREREFYFSKFRRFDIIASL